MMDIKEYVDQFSNATVPKGHITEINNMFILTPAILKDDIFHSGKILGRKKGNKFIPSFPLLDHIGKQSDQKVIVDDKTAYLFTCGRDIFPKNVGQYPSGKVFLVSNKHDEILGVVTPQKDILKNIIDRGIFLRREMN